MKKGIVVFTVVIMMLLVINSALAQKEKYQSIFIYNFSKYVKWPSDQGGKFVIGVLGNSPILKNLQDMAESKKVNGMSIEVKKIQTAESMKDCNILYITSGESNKIDEVVTATQNLPVLIVTDKPGLAIKGAAINFVEIDGKIKFELNQKNVEDRGMKVSSSLSSLAIQV